MLHLIKDAEELEDFKKKCQRHATLFNCVHQTRIVEPQGDKNLHLCT